MRPVVLTAAAVLLIGMGLLGGATFAWAIWVISTGDGWLLEIMFSSGSAMPPFLILSSVSAATACVSFWGARRIFRKRSVVQPT